MGIPPPPVFGIVSDDKIGKPGIVSLVDIFDEFMFSNERNQFSYQEGADGSSTHTKEDDGDYDSLDEDDIDESGRKRKRSRGIQRNMTEEQKIERR